MTVRIRFALALAVFVVAGHAALAQTTPKYQYKQGDALAYVLSVVQKGSTKGPDMEFSGAQKQEIELTWVVQSVDDKGNAKIALKFNRAKLSAEAPKDRREVSSDEKEEPTDEPGKQLYGMARVLAKLEGTITVSPKGEIQSVSVPASVLKEIKAIPGAEKTLDTWAEEHLQSALKDNMLVLPGVPIARGKTWKSPIKGQCPFGKITGDTQYTYEGTVERDGRKVEKFAMKPRVKIEPDPKAQVTFTVKTYEVDGVAYFDNATGRLVEVTSTQHLEVDAESMGKTYTQKTETTNSFKLVKSGK